MANFLEALLDTTNETASVIQFLTHNDHKSCSQTCQIYCFRLGGYWGDCLINCCPNIVGHPQDRDVICPIVAERDARADHPYMNKDECLIVLNETLKKELLLRKNIDSVSHKEFIELLELQAKTVEKMMERIKDFINVPINIKNDIIKVLIIIVKRHEFIINSNAPSLRELVNKMDDFNETWTIDLLNVSNKFNKLLFHAKKK